MLSPSSSRLAEMAAAADGEEGGFPPLTPGDERRERRESGETDAGRARRKERRAPRSSLDMEGRELARLRRGPRPLLSRDSLSSIKLDKSLVGRLPNVRLLLEDGMSVRALHAEWDVTSGVDLFKEYRAALSHVDSIEMYLSARVSSLGGSAKDKLVLSEGGEYAWVEPSEPLLGQLLVRNEAQPMVELVIRIRSFLGFSALELSDFESVHAAFLHVRSQLLAGELDGDLDEPILIRLAALQLQAEEGSAVEGDPDPVFALDSVVPASMVSSVASADVALLYKSLPRRPCVDAERAFIDICSTLTGFGGFSFRTFVKGVEYKLMVSPDGLSFSREGEVFVYPLEALVSWSMVEDKPRCVELELLRDDFHGLAGEEGGRRVVMDFESGYAAADLLSCLFAHDAY